MSLPSVSRESGDHRSVHDELKESLSDEWKPGQRVSVHTWAGPTSQGATCTSGHLNSKSPEGAPLLTLHLRRRGRGEQQTLPLGGETGTGNGDPCRLQVDTMSSHWHYVGWFSPFNKSTEIPPPGFLLANSCFQSTHKKFTSGPWKQTGGTTSSPWCQWLGPSTGWWLPFTGPQKRRWRAVSGCLTTVKTARWYCQCSAPSGPLVEVKEDRVGQEELLKKRGRRR